MKLTILLFSFEVALLAVIYFITGNIELAITISFLIPLLVIAAFMTLYLIIKMTTDIFFYN